MSEILRKFSEQLKSKRLAKKITLDQIHSKTRIDKKFLEALEEGNFSLMPEVYMKAFLKEYCNFIGLNTDEMISKYELAKQGLNFENEVSEPKSETEKPKKNESKSTKKETIAAPKATLPVKENVVEEPKVIGEESVNHNITKQLQKNNSLYYALFAIVLLLVIFVVYNTFLRDPENSFITEKPFEETLTTNEILNSNKIDLTTEAVKTDSSSKDSTNQIVNEHEDIGKTQVFNSGLELKITCDDKAWVRVVTDEKDNIEFILSKDMTRSFNAKDQFLLHIGNSGSIKLYLNNKELEFNKAPGRSRKMIINKNGIQYLSLKNTVQNEG